LEFIERNPELPENLKEKWRANFATTGNRNRHGTATWMIPALVDACFAGEYKESRETVRRVENRAPWR